MRTIFKLRLARTLALPGVVMMLMCASANAQVGGGFFRSKAAGGGGWTPTTPSNTLLWWIDVSDSTTTFTDTGLTTPGTSNGSVIAAVKDKSINAKNATQSTSGSRPTLVTNYKNSRSALAFDGVDDALISATWTVSSQPWTVFIAFESDSTARPVFSGVAKRNLLGAGASVYRIYADTGADFANTAVNYDGGWHIAKIVFNGASSTFAFDGAADTTFSSDPGSGGSEGVTLGAYETLNQFGVVHIGEMFIHAGTLSSGDSSSAFTYLNTKWAVY